MTLQQIIYAVKIAELGSMNKASENLFISQPSMTNAVKELEREIVIEIFERTNRGMIPTSDGKYFLNICKAYVYLWKNHPLAGKESISFDELEPYPCLSFDQGDNESFFSFPKRF